MLSHVEKVVTRVHKLVIKPLPSPCCSGSSYIYGQSRSYGYPSILQLSILKNFMDLRMHNRYLDFCFLRLREYWIPIISNKEDKYKKSEIGRLKFPVHITTYYYTLVITMHTSSPLRKIIVFFFLKTSLRLVASWVS